ncbi:lysylphosphatidylglycerol synthase transmembrane domain-containing protein [Ekhidna sp.]|uniref:lysylphosphatidylglycerol synthase transmembrane domain-containing protein n=1 Tax=Ekhidna sp. TaxID=2608089 RepID=UPI003C79B649
MSKNLIILLKTLISIGLAGLLLYLVFRNIEWTEFWRRAKTVDYTWVIASILLSIVAYVARAYRWNILLEPLGYQLKTSRTTLAVLVGYLANLAFPRLGEITRCGVLKRNDDVAVPSSLGSVVTERIIDVLTLLVLILISLIVESERLFTFLRTAYSDLQIPTYIVISMIAFALIGVIALIIFIKRQDKLKGKFAVLIKSFIAGFLSLKDIKKPIGFVVSTVVLWVVYYLMSYIIIFSLPETAHLGLGAGFMLLITGGIALSLPVQSGFGTYHGMIAGMLLLYSIDQTTGVFLATLLHTSQILAIALFGSMALIISVVIRRKTVRKETN